MKTTCIIIAALYFSTGIILSQNSNSPVTVRIKKVETINGVEKVSDTTYITNDPTTIIMDDPAIKVADFMAGSESKRKIVIKSDEDAPEIILDNAFGDPVETITLSSIADAEKTNHIKTIIVNDPSGKRDSSFILIHLDEKMKDLSSDLNELDKKTQTVLIDADTEMINKDHKQEIRKIIIIKKIDLLEPSAEETTRLNKQTGISDKKLSIDKLNVYPNPNSGKFNLSFNLKTKGHTEISVLNPEGKSVYKEDLGEFSGNYNKEIDISSQPKGIYFVKIKQAEHAQLKKIILE